MFAMAVSVFNLSLARLGIISAMGLARLVIVKTSPVSFVRAGWMSYCVSSAGSRYRVSVGPIGQRHRLTGNDLQTYRLNESTHLFVHHGIGPGVSFAVGGRAESNTWRGLNFFGNRSATLGRINQVLANRLDKGLPVAVSVVTAIWWAALGLGATYVGCNLLWSGSFQAP